MLLSMQLTQKWNPPTLLRRSPHPHFPSPEDSAESPGAWELWPAHKTAHLRTRASCCLAPWHGALQWCAKHPVTAATLRASSPEGRGRGPASRGRGGFHAAASFRIVGLPARLEPLALGRDEPRRHAYSRVPGRHGLVDQRRRRDGRPRASRRGARSGCRRWKCRRAARQGCRPRHGAGARGRMVSTSDSDDTWQRASRIPTEHREFPPRSTPLFYLPLCFRTVLSFCF